MPKNVFGNPSHDNNKKIDTNLFVQKHYLRSNYIEANIEEDIKMKNHFKMKNLPDPINTQDACSKNYIDKLFNDPSIIENTSKIDVNDRNITNTRFIQVNQLPQIDSHFTAKLYVDNSIDEPSLVRNNEDSDFNNYNLTNINRITLSKQAENDNELITKAYVDQFHQEIERSRRVLGFDFYNESSDLVEYNQDNTLNDMKLTNVDSIIVNGNPTSDNEVSNKIYIDDELGKNTIVRFIQTLQNYLKVSIGIDTYNLTKQDKIQITDVTIKKTPNNGGYLLQNWVIICNGKNGKYQISLNQQKQTLQQVILEQQAYH